MSEEVWWFVGGLAAAIVIRLLYEDPKQKATRKQKAFSIVSGVSLAIFATPEVVSWTSIESVRGIGAVAGALALTGDNIIRAFIVSGPAIADRTMQALFHFIEGFKSNDK